MQRAVSHREASQVRSAGDDRRASGRGGQQGPHLLGVAGVVEHHEDAALVQYRPQQAGLLVRKPGHDHRRMSEGPDERGQRVLRRLAARATGAAQIEPQLTVREAGGHATRHVNGE